MPVKADQTFASNPEHLVQLGCALMDSGQGAKAVALVTNLLAQYPDDRQLREAASMVMTRGVPKFHLGMLADTARNNAYQKAIERAAPAGKTVLDIGAGSGLLAMMAARAGAARVYACEAVPALAATAREIVAANGFADVIEIIPTHSTKLDSTTDLGGGADILVTEIFSHDLIGEGVLPSVADAVARLVRPGARIIPARASIQVALADYSGELPGPIGMVNGFDLGRFHRHVDTAVHVNAGHKKLSMRSAPSDLFRFDLAGPAGEPGVEASLRVSTSGGRVNGIVQWILLELDDENVYENAPAPGARSHWPCVFHPLPEEIGPERGKEIFIHGWRDLHRLRIWSGE